MDPKAKSLDTVTEYELGPQEDTPMAMAMNLKVRLLTPSLLTFLELGLIRGLACFIL